MRAFIHRPSDIATARASRSGLLVNEVLDQPALGRSSRGPIAPAPGSGAADRWLLSFIAQQQVNRQTPSPGSIGRRRCARRARDLLAPDPEWRSANQQDRQRVSSALDGKERQLSVMKAAINGVMAMEGWGSFLDNKARTTAFCARPGRLYFAVKAFKSRLALSLSMSSEPNKAIRNIRNMVKVLVKPSGL
jgi:hypothetical protein